MKKNKKTLSLTKDLCKSAIKKIKTEPIIDHPPTKGKISANKSSIKSAI